MDPGVFVVDRAALASKRALCVTALTLFYYDYFLTFPREVNWIWSSTRKRISVIHIIFYFNRYATFLGQAAVATRNFMDATQPDDAVCRLLLPIKQGLMYAVHLCAAIFSIFRVYGLYNRNRRVLWMMSSLLLLVLAGALSLLALGTKDKEIDHTGLVDNCFRNITDERGQQYALQYMCLMLFDLVIFLMTLYKSIQHARKNPTRLVQTIIRDGTLSFGVMALLCLVIILSFLFSDPVSRGREVVLATSLSSMLVSRMILNLRDPTLVTQSLANANTSINNEGRTATYSESGNVPLTVEYDDSVRYDLHEDVLDTNHFRIEYGDSEKYLSGRRSHMV